MELIITYNINDLQEVSVYDGTEFTSPASITDINGVRFLFETVNSNLELELATTCTAWKEYEVLSGTAVANGVSYATGSTMLFANDTTPTGTFTMRTTGRYGQYISNILPSALSGWSFTPTQTGRNAFNTLYFTDEVFTLNAYYYDTKVVSGGSLISGRTYLAVNTLGADVVVSVAGTKAIYIGEVYTATGAEVITTPDVNTFMVEFLEEGQFSFATLFQSFVVWRAYLVAKATAIPPSEILDSNLLTVASLIASPQIAAQTTEGIDLQGLQDNIDRILNYYAVQV
jgi:hypothetical protein